jgi:hypothetical protein
MKNYIVATYDSIYKFTLQEGENISATDHNAIFVLNTDGSLKRAFFGTTYLTEDVDFEVAPNPNNQHF